LVFVNTRRLVEKISFELSARLGSEHVAAHHGSLSRTLRLDAEQRLKNGEIKILIATGSLELGIDLSSIERGLTTMRPVPGRMELMDVRQDFHAYVDYAHTEDALRNVLMTVSELTKGRLIVVFGCGGDRDKGKRAPMGEAA